MYPACSPGEQGAALRGRNGESNAARENSERAEYREQPAAPSKMARIAGTHGVFVCLGDCHRRVLAGTLDSLSAGAAYWWFVRIYSVSAVCRAGSKAVCLCGCAPGRWNLSQSAINLSSWSARFAAATS